LKTKEHPAVAAAGNGGTMKTTCKTCDGKGKIEIYGTDTEYKCPACGGCGRVEE